MLRVRELNPCRRVITGLFPAANVAVDGCRFEAPRYDGTEQEMVDAQPRVAAASIPEIIPECIDALVRMERSQHIGPALSDEASIEAVEVSVIQRDSCSRARTIFVM